MRSILQIEFINTQMVEEGLAREHIKLDGQLTFYNDMFGWARVTYEALTHHSPPDILLGSSPEGATG